MQTNASQTQHLNVAENVPSIGSVSRSKDANGKTERQETQKTCEKQSSLSITWAASWGDGDGGTGER